jgi:hypothetical protein
MDQVLVNFLGGARKALGKEFNDPCLGPDHDKWLILAKLPAFWVNLEWMPGAQLLWHNIKGKNTYILSACPRKDENPMCPTEKKAWCERELGIPQSRVFTVDMIEKKNFAKDDAPNLLIDDHLGNVLDWQAAGGIGIHHNTVPETLEELKQYGIMN